MGRLHRVALGSCAVVLALAAQAQAAYTTRFVVTSWADRQPVEGLYLDVYRIEFVSRIWYGGRALQTGADGVADFVDLSDAEVGFVVYDCDGRVYSIGEAGRRYAEGPRLREVRLSVMPDPRGGNLCLDVYARQRASARVQLHDESGHWLFSTDTDASGRLLYDRALAPGTYVVSIYIRGYFRERRVVEIRDGETAFERVDMTLDDDPR